ncbi:tyrosine-protein kinase Wzc [Serratia sp. J2]|uniref:tyrosine-protein kinase Wzc n=1 Tax=Serratia sp. J2 TaxID=3386551 RepID=UPI003916E84D
MSDKNKVSASMAKEDSELDLRRFLGAIIDHKWLIIAITTFFATSAIMYSLLATPIYKADALVQVEQNVGSSLLNDLSQILPNNQSVSAPEIELIKSRMVLVKTIQDLNLDTFAEQKYFPVIGKGIARVLDNKEKEILIPRLIVQSEKLDKRMLLELTSPKTYELSFDGEKVLTGQVGQLEKSQGVTILVSDVQGNKGTAFNVEKRSILTVLEELRENFSVVDSGKDTGVLNLSLLGNDPDKIQKTLEKIANNYLQQNVERKSAEAAKSLEFLKEQLPLVRSDLDNAESKLNEYRRKNDSVDLSLEAKSVLDSMVSVDTQLNELTFKEAEISKLYTKEHPSYKALLEKRSTLVEEKEKLNKRIGGMPQTQQNILRLTRDVQSGQEVYMQLLNKQQELSINKASTVGNVRIVDQAITQLKPVSPKKLLIVILSVLGGGILSVFFIVLKTLLYRGVESPEQLEELGINVYAGIPLSEWQKKKDMELISRRNNKKINTRSCDLLATRNPTDLAIEAIRSLRTSLHFAMMESKNNVLMISGASPSIGKTFVSANLAAVTAQAGLKVLLIDGDMRKGYAHELMGVTSKMGLSDVLSGRLGVEDVLEKTEVENLNFIARGTIPPNPAELLMTTRFANLVEWASKNYDLVLIDTPPILAVTDSAIIGRQAGTVLLVARFEVNTVKEVEVSIRRFEQNGVDVRGVILNAVIKKASSYYNYGYYNYDYSYESEIKK